jgi:putative inorganic carbon (HCO3(-)) transporter
LASLLVLGGVILTYSRPTLLAVYLALLFMGIVKKDKVMIALLALLLLVLPFIVPQSVKDFARELNYNPLFFMCNEDRVAIFRNTFGMVKAHPFVGVGANVSMKAYRYYKESPEFHNTITKDEMKAHNNFLQMAAEIGLVGLGIFLWFLFRLFSQAATSYRQLNDPYLKLITLSVAACLFAFLVNGLTESSLYYSRVALLFWYLCGLLLSLKRIKGLCY